MFGIEVPKKKPEEKEKNKLFHMSKANDVASPDDIRLVNESNDYNDYRIRRDEEGHDTPPLDRGLYKAIKDGRM